MQHQLSLNGKSWDEFFTECDLGPTQYWPNPSPKTRRKRKATVKPEVNNVPKTELEGKGLEEAKLPINVDISNEDVGNTVPCRSEVALNQSPPDKSYSTPVKT